MTSLLKVYYTVKNLAILIYTKTKEMMQENILKRKKQTLTEEEEYAICSYKSRLTLYIPIFSSTYRDPWQFSRDISVSLLGSMVNRRCCTGGNRCSWSMK